MKTKRLTKKYWNSLPKDSKRRALTCVFPLHKGIVEMLIEEEPRTDEVFWKLVFRKVRIPDDGFYKTVVNNTYIP